MRLVLLKTGMHIEKLRGRRGKLDYLCKVYGHFSESGPTSRVRWQKLGNFGQYSFIQFLDNTGALIIKVKSFIFKSTQRLI